MIKEFVLAWDANKDKLSEYIASHKQECYNSYMNIVKMLFEQVINPYMTAHDKDTFNIEQVHEIDDGGYQGTLLYMIPPASYQPSYWEYVATYVYYGSCSGCDTLLGISGYGDDLPDADQVKDYVELCLNILQHCKYPFNYKEDYHKLLRTMNENNRKRDAMVNDIICDFDFERVQAIMVLMDVKWYGLKGGDERHTPSVDEIIAVSREILTEAYDKHKTDPEYTGYGKYHMYAEVFNDGQLELTYRPFSASSFESSYNEDGSHNENY